MLSERIGEGFLRSLTLHRLHVSLPVLCDALGFAHEIDRKRTLGRERCEIVRLMRHLRGTRWGLFVAQHQVLKLTVQTWISCGLQGCTHVQRMCVQKIVQICMLRMFVWFCMCVYLQYSYLLYMLNLNAKEMLITKTRRDSDVYSALRTLCEVDSFMLMLLCLLIPMFQTTSINFFHE